MILLKEKADKDLQQHNAEMKELVRIIDHDRKLRDFMYMKGKEREEDKQLVKWRERKGINITPASVEHVVFYINFGILHLHQNTSNLFFGILSFLWSISTSLEYFFRVLLLLQSTSSSSSEYFFFRVPPLLLQSTSSSEYFFFFRVPPLLLQSTSSSEYLLFFFRVLLLQSTSSSSSEYFFFFRVLLQSTSIFFGIFLLQSTSYLSSSIGPSPFYLHHVSFMFSAILTDSLKYYLFTI